MDFQPTHSKDAEMTAHIASLMPRLGTRASGIMRNAADGADVLQNALLLLWRFRDKFDPDKATFSQWAQTVLRHAAKSFFRQQSRHFHLREDDGVDMVDDYETGRMTARLDLHDLTDVFNNLSRGEQDILARIAIFGWAPEDVAEDMKIKKGTVYTKLFKARAHLSDLIEERDKKFDSLHI